VVIDFQRRKVCYESWLFLCSMRYESDFRRNETFDCLCLNISMKESLFIYRNFIRRLRLHSVIPDHDGRYDSLYYALSVRTFQLL
jgi:hypothetical protein